MHSDQVAPSLALAAPMGTRASVLRRLIGALPKGRQLTHRVWVRRHRAAVLVAAFQAVGVFVFGLYRQVGIAHAALETILVASIAGLAWWSTSGPTLRSAYSTMALLTASAIFVHRAGGTTEWHFHFFVMIGLITLYQDWVPFVVAIAFVVLHHGVMGGIDPEGVFGTPAAIEEPWRWALIHGAFVLAAASVHVVAWRMSEEQGVTDPLTGLPNRAGFTELVDQLIARSSSVAVLFLDLDGFKRINDGLGHDAGDEVLERVGARVREVLRSGDHAARLGGDEFAIVISGPVTADAQRIAERLVLAVAESIYIRSRQREVQLRASVGIAMSAPGVEGGELVRRADIAMYSAKGHGGGRWAMFEASLEVAQQERAEFADDLRGALHGRQLHLVYQPVVDLMSGGICGVEALMRWNHPRRGAVTPARFIPIAEETGLIVEMGEWALDSAIAQLAAWTAEGLTEMQVAVNVSTRQLHEPEFGDRVLARLSRHGIAPRRLVLELTESMLVVDLDETAAQLQALRHHGVRVAIDDFGTGYSSMSYLSRLPVDVVKIDQSFVQRVATSATEAALVRSMIELASNLRLDIVAEGVEHASQADALRTLRCSTGQGYLWSKPVPPARIPELVAAASPRVDSELSASVAPS